MKAPTPPNSTLKSRYAVRHPDFETGAICETQPLPRDVAFANAREKRRMGGYVVAITRKGQRVRVTIQ